MRVRNEFGERDPLGTKAKFVRERACRSRRRFGGEHRFGFGDGEGERLLAEHVLSGAKCGEHVVVMGEGWRCDDDGIELASCDHLGTGREAPCDTLFRADSCRIPRRGEGEHVETCVRA